MESDSQPTRRLAFRSPRIGSTIEVFWDDPGQWYAAIVLRELPDEGQAVFEVEYPESRTQTDFVTSQEVLSQSTWNKLWRWHNRSASTGTDTQLKNGTSDYVALHKLVQAGRIPLGNEVLQVQFEGARWRVDVLEDALCRESGTTGPIFTDPAMLTLALKRRISPGLFKDEALQSLSFEGRSLATMLAEECPTQRPVDESPAAAALVTPPAVASKPQRPDAVCKSVSHPVSQETSAAPSHCDTKNAAATKKDTPAASTSTCAHDPTNSMTPTPGASSQQHRESTPELQEKDPCRQEEELVFDADFIAQQQALLNTFRQLQYSGGGSRYAVNHGLGGGRGKRSHDKKRKQQQQPNHGIEDADADGAPARKRAPKPRALPAPITLPARPSGPEKLVETQLRSLLLDNQRFPQRTAMVDADDVTTEWVFSESGFRSPCVVRDIAGLSMPWDYTIKRIGSIVGMNADVEVIDVGRQRQFDKKWSMAQWQKYFHDPKSRAEYGPLNVLSLEISHIRKLDSQVVRPKVVRQIDWIDQVWRQYRPGKHHIPRVRKYCIMSVKGSFTDFHIDFGGSSVWYHVLSGEKVFWFAPPTEHNLAVYERLNLSPTPLRQICDPDGDDPNLLRDVFFIRAYAKQTLLIPAGWIHAVYSPQDCLVFGGNFLHDQGISNQIRVAQIELQNSVPTHFKYPHFDELHWCALASIVRRALNGLGGTLLYSQETSGLPLLQTRNGKDQACSKFTASDKSAVKTDLVNGSPSLSEKTPKLTNQSVNQCHDQLPRPAVAHVRALVTYLTQQLHSYEKVIQQSSEVPQEIIDKLSAAKFAANWVQTGLSPRDLLSACAAVAAGAHTVTSTFVTPPRSGKAQVPSPSTVSVDKTLPRLEIN